ncbi:MAG: SAM-dependent methyltransferase [Defluviitaleaceae bacterium]|nr:SAM-dependent methyltransferase [Defluviitaleaceae bacterium]
MLTEAIFNAGVYKIILSSPTENSRHTRVEIIKTGEGFQAAMYTAKQVFHHNMGADAVKAFTEGLLGTDFKQYTAWDGRYRYTARVRKKGKYLTSRTADTTPQKEEKKKNALIREGMDIPALADMGADREKLIQINRFLELLSDGTRRLSQGDAVNIIDFGCGKSYLSFLIYHYFTVTRGLRVRMCGLDNDEKLVAQCNEASRRYGYTGLFFLHGDIGEQKNPPLPDWGQEGAFNIVVSLHACDTATDYAFYNAVKWDADLICAVPCCQHELRGQMRPGVLPLFSRYGIIQERVASLATDAIRAALLESQGYKTQIIELTDRENTAKNLMIRAVKTERAARSEHEKAACHEVEQMAAAFGFEPMLRMLLR